MPGGSPPHRVVTLDDTEALFFAIQTTLNRLDYLRLKDLYLVSKRYGIPVSFGSDWIPFLGHTRGFNHTKREYITDDSRILADVKDYVQQLDRSRPGGRVFLSRQEARIDKVVLTTWDWTGECPVARLTRFRDVRKAELYEDGWQCCRDELKKAWQRKDIGDLSGAEYHRKKARESLANVSRESEFDILTSQVDGDHRYVMESAEQHKEFVVQLEQLIQTSRKTS